MLRAIFNDLIVLTTAPEILFRILFCPETLEPETQKVSKYMQWVLNHVESEK